MLPSINGVPVRVYKIPPTTERYQWRNKYKNREDAYTLLATVSGQPYFFNADDLRIREGLGYFRSLGYIVLASHSLRALSISPAPDGSSWVNYRLEMKVDGFWKARYLKVVEARPRSPLRGTFKLWYIYFDEELIEDTLPDRESTIEEVPKDVGDTIVERVISHDVHSNY